MKILDHIQGSEEWFAARCGIPTSSNFDKILTTKGVVSKQREKYLYRLAGEKITGKSEETYKNDAMLRGQEMEAEARSLYELMTGSKVEQVGLCVTEGKIVYGASPDGLVGKDGILEIKCPLISTHVGYLLNKELPMDYYQQLQGQLLVTGRKWVDFMSYYPSMRPLIIRVKRNESFIKTLELELSNFCLELKKIVDKIK